MFDEHVCQKNKWKDERWKLPAVLYSTEKRIKPSNKIQGEIRPSLQKGKQHLTCKFFSFKGEDA